MLVQLSSLPIAIDATCSGLQILAGLAKDKSKAELVNVLPSDKIVILIIFHTPTTVSGVVASSSSHPIVKRNEKTNNIDSKFFINAPIVDSS